MNTFSTTLNNIEVMELLESGNVDLKLKKLQVIGENGAEVAISGQKITVKISDDSKNKIDNALSKDDAESVMQK